MKNRLNCILFILLCFGFSLSSAAQGISGYAGVTLPTGDFGSQSVKWGGAALGPQLGIQYSWDVKHKGLFVFLGADIMYNGLKSNTLDYWQGSPNNFDNTHEFINVPVTAGLRYVVKMPDFWFLRLNKHLCFFAEAGAGPDFMKVTNDANYYNQKDDYIRGYKLSTRFGYKAGGGFTLNEKYTLGFHYFGLGAQDLKYSNGSGKVNNVKVDMCSLTLGVNFRAFRKK